MFGVFYETLLSVYAGMWWILLNPFFVYFLFITVIYFMICEHLLIIIPYEYPIQCHIHLVTLAILIFLIVMLFVPKLVITTGVMFCYLTESH